MGLSSIAGLASAGLAPVAIDGAGDAQGFDLHFDAARAGATVVLLHVAVREMVDVLAPGILFPLDHTAEDLRPAPHVLGVDQQQGDARIALQVLEPAAIRPAVDPER